eukprot:6672567-Pyramimonas_sp.AAC.1
MQGPRKAVLEAFRAGRGQRRWPRLDRGGKVARVPLGKLPILTVRVDRIAPEPRRAGATGNRTEGGASSR